MEIRNLVNGKSEQNNLSKKRLKTDVITNFQELYIVDS